VHRLDAAHLYRLVLEKGSGGAWYHRVVDESLPTRDIAEIIGRRLNLPLETKASEEDGPASSAQTPQRLGMATDTAWADGRSRSGGVILRRTRWQPDRRRLPN
jgi:hypothetical protein